MNTPENKNPLLAGLFNVLIPGAGSLYLNKDWSKFIRSFVVYVLILVIAALFGNSIQHVQGYSLPQGVCMGTLLMIVVAIMFFTGYRAAVIQNSTVDAATFYNSKRHKTHESEEKDGELQKMRDEGLISQQDYDQKSARQKPDKTDSHPDK